MAENSNEDLQAELSALEAIYDEELKKPNSTSSFYKIKIDLAEAIIALTFCFKFPENYPHSPSPPIYEFADCSWLTTDHLVVIDKKLNELWAENSINRSQGIIYIWIEWIRHNLFEYLAMELLPKLNESQQDTKEPEDAISIQSDFDIIHGLPVNDRKSKFQAHLAEVKSIDEVEQVLQILLSNKRIRIATHNLYAYRIKIPGKPIIESREDDGEVGGADKILYVLQTQSVENVLVVVSRYFGGILLGPDRFKHIQNVTMDIVAQHMASKKQDESAPRSRLTPSDEIFSRIKWDPSMNQEEFDIGYKDRFEGIMEISFTEFQNSAEIPFHRVCYFKRNGEVVWDREKRIDLLTNKHN